MKAQEHDSFINYTQPPKLQSIALVSVAVRLLTEPDMCFNSSNNLPCFAELKERALNKLSGIAIPDLLKIKISNIIEPIGLQLSKTNYHYILRIINCNSHDIFKIGGSVYYTMEGVIDCVKSLKEVIRNENQVKDIGYVYELACKYCLEEDISYLCQKMNFEIKKKFYSTYYYTYKYCIVDYWSAYFKNELPSWFSKITINDNYNIIDSNKSINQNMVSMSVFLGNIFSFKYFWNKLTEQEKDINIDIWINMVLKILDLSFEIDITYQHYNPFADILFFLLSKLNDQHKQKSAFQTKSWVILNALFNCWPWQRFFLPTITRMFDYLPEHVFCGMLCNITEEIKEGRTTGELVREICHLSPIKFKNCSGRFIDDLLWNLLEINDTKTIDVIISSFSAEERHNIALKIMKNYKFINIILLGQFTFLDTITIKILPIDYTVRFKMQMLQEYRRLISLLIIRNDLRILDDWLNWFSPSQNKIKLLKAEIINLMKMYISLIRLNDYDRVNVFLKWYFETEEDITTFKKAFVQEGNFSRCFSLLVEMSNDTKAGWNKFETFINYSLSSSEEVCQFKKLYLKSVSTFLKLGHLKFATNFLHWCFNSSDEVNRYKNELLLSKKGIGMLLYRLNYTSFSWDSFRCSLKWFYPLTNETVNKLKSLKDSRFIGFRDDYAPKHKKQAFIYLLGCLSSNYTSEAGWANDIIDANHIKNILKGKDITADSNSGSSSDRE